MNFNAVFFSWMLAAALMPALAWAQPVSEPAEAEAAGPTERVLVRSPLWKAVEAHYRQRDVANPAVDRRLTAEQRQELRDQVRRASVRHEVVSPSAERAGQR